MMAMPVDIRKNRLFRNMPGKIGSEGRGRTGHQIKHQDQQNRDDALPERPVQHHGEHHQHQDQPRIIRRRGSFGRINHPGNRRRGQEQQDDALETDNIFSRNWVLKTG